jgi:hypothetical protein
MRVVGSARERSSFGSSLDIEESSSEDSCVDFSSEERRVDFPEEEAVLPGLSVCWTGDGEVSSEEGKTWRRGDCCVGLVDLTDETSSIASCINVAVLDTGDNLPSIKGELLIDLQLPPFAFTVGTHLLEVLSLNKFSK